MKKKEEAEIEEKCGHCSALLVENRSIQSEKDK